MIQRTKTDTTIEIDGLTFERRVKGSFRPISEQSSDARYFVYRRKLMKHDPRCFACGRVLSDDKSDENFAHYVAHRLACRKHVKHVRACAKVGESRVPSYMIEKASQQKIPCEPETLWFVENRSFTTIEGAEAHAIHLARVLGVKIEIFVWFGGCTAHQRCQIVRPGDDAACRDASFHHQRRKLIETTRRED